MSRPDDFEMKASPKETMTTSEPDAAKTSADMYEFRHEQERVDALRSMQKYYETKPEQVKLFEELVHPFLTEATAPRVLDACCGLGDLTYFLSRLNPQARFVGIDRAGFLLEQARHEFKENPHVTFQEADVNALSEKFAANSFDLSVCKQTLSWLPSYEDAVRELMNVTERAVFLSSLFYDGRIDFNIRVREYETEAGRAGFNGFYNIYSFPVFRDFCIAQGAREVVGFDFKIGIDLPRPASLDRMGTFTMRLEDGERLQVSGALLMPWKIVRIDL